MEIKANKEGFEKTCSVFINTVNNYFTSLTTQPTETGVPYLKERDQVVLRDFTGRISISGFKTGLVYITGNKSLYCDLIQEFIGLENPSDEDVLDMAGELSNVIVGNMRETYGNNFLISTPTVFQGAPDELKFPDNAPIYVIPINWKNYQADLVIGLE